MEKEIKGILVEFFREGRDGDYLEALTKATSKLINVRTNVVEIILDKTDAIKRFKYSCGSLANQKQREIAVKGQYCRNTWDIPDTKGGLIRISCSKAPLYQITVFYPVGSNPENPVQQFELTWQEYDELRDAFFGRIEPDVPYLQSIGALG